MPNLSTFDPDEVDDLALAGPHHDHAVGADDIRAELRRARSNLAAASQRFGDALALVMTLDDALVEAEAVGRD